MNLKDLIEDFREDSGEVDEELFPDNSVIKLLNRGGREICLTDAFAIDRRFSWAEVANKESYTLPDDFYADWFVRVNESYRPRKVDFDEISSYVSNRGATGDPFKYFLFDGNLGLYYIPGSNGATSTVASNIASADSSITIVTPSGTLPERGTVLINSERIRYEKVTVSGSNSVLSVLTRGVQDTAAAAHTTGDAVAVLGIELVYFAKYREHLYCPETGRVDLTGQQNLVTQGRHYIMWTYYDTVRGLESYPKSLLSVTVTSAGEKIALSDLRDDADLKGYSKRIYVTKAGETQPFYLLTTLDSGTDSYDMNVADATLSAGDEFSMDSVGGGNLPDDFLGAQSAWAVMKYLERRKRYNEAKVFEDMYVRNLSKGIEATYRRRSVSVEAMRVDIDLGL